MGISAGVSYGALGSTHHSLHDFAVLRAINNIIIVAPADNFETVKATELAAASDIPVYLRFGKKVMPSLKTDNSDGFVFGKGRVITEGDDVAIIANGETVYPALQAAERLKANGIAATVVSMHSIKPLDTELIKSLAKKCTAIVTVEEHSVYGGLGEAVASFLLQSGIALPFKIMGIPDEYTVTGPQGDIFKHYGISEEGVAGEVMKLLTITNFKSQVSERYD